MDLELTGTKEEIDDLVQLIKGCPAYTDIRVSEYTPLTRTLNSCRVEFSFDDSVPGGKDSPTVFAKYQRALSSTTHGYAGGRSPYGYRAHKGSYLVDEKEAEAVRIIFDLRSAGRSLTYIADELNSLAIPSSTGKLWHYTAIQSILANRNTYLGYYHYGKSTPWVNGTHPAILDKDSYEPDFSKEGYKPNDDSSGIRKLEK